MSDSCGTDRVWASTRETEPCGTCPWRKGSDPAKIPGLSLDQARGLLGCSGDEDGWYPIMACHGSRDGNDRPCIGYLGAAEAWSNLRVRMLAITEQVDVSAIWEAREHLDLFETWVDALEWMESQGG